MEYLSIYLVLLLFCSPELYSLPHIDLVHILLDLHLSISFLRNKCKWYCVFISNSTCSLLIYRMIDFCILTLYPETLVYSLTSSRNFFINFFSDYLHRWWYHLWTKTVLFHPFESIHLLFPFLVFALASTSSTMLRTVMGTNFQL